jgi:hypothetical protein
MLLDPLVEREPPSADGPGLRQRAEAGNALLVALEDAGFDRFRQAVLDNCPLPTVSPSADDAAFDRLALMCAGRLPDSEQAAQAVEAGASLAAWIAPDDDAQRAALADVFGQWLSWYRAEVQPLVEFAMTFGSDWVIVPLVVPHGSLTSLTSVTYTTTFGERFLVRSTSDMRPNDAWRMYAISGAGPVVNALLVAPGSLQVQSGPKLEEVLFMRDEMANLAWAIERTITEASGDARARGNEPGAHVVADRTPGPVATADLDYRLATPVPIHWTTYVPTSDGYRSIELLRGRIQGKPGPARTAAQRSGPAAIIRRGGAARGQPGAAKAAAISRSTTRASERTRSECDRRSWWTESDCRRQSRCCARKC